MVPRNSTHYQDKKERERERERENKSEWAKASGRGGRWGVTLLTSDTKEMNDRAALPSVLALKMCSKFFVTSQLLICHRGGGKQEKVKAENKEKTLY